MIKSGAHLNNLGYALQAVFERTGDAGAKAEAVSCFHGASLNTATTALVRLEAFRGIATLVGIDPAGADQAEVHPVKPGL